MSPLSLVSAAIPSFAMYSFHFKWSFFFHVLFFPSIASPVTAFLTGFICRAFVVASLLPRGCLSGTELSSIITLAPGLSLAIAAMELSSRSIVAGTSRLVSALAVSFLIGLGLSFGEEMAALFDPFTRNLTVAGATTPAIPACVPISLWWLFLSFPLCALCFFILLDAPFDRWFVCFLVSCLAFWSSFGLVYTPLSVGVQTLLASSAVGLFSSVYSLISVRPSSSVIYMGIVFLVPGALSIRTFQGAFSGGGVDFGLSFLLLSVSVALGILVASVPRFRRKALNASLANSQYAGANMLV